MNLNYFVGVLLKRKYEGSISEETLVYEAIGKLPPQVITPCPCLSRRAHQDALEEADTAYPWDSYHDETKEKKMEKFYQTILQKHPLVNQPDPECESCLGSGLIVFPAPLIRWRVGGNWDGAVIQDQEKPPLYWGPIERVDCSSPQSLKNNLTRVTKLPPEISFFGLISPQGEWLLKDPSRWYQPLEEEETKAILTRYSNCWLVGYHFWFDNPD